jgi:hypothetical protein
MSRGELKKSLNARYRWDNQLWAEINGLTEKLNSGVR